MWVWKGVCLARVGSEVWQSNRDADGNETSPLGIPTASFTLAQEQRNTGQVAARGRGICTPVTDCIFERLFGSATNALCEIYFGLLTVCTGISWLFYLLSPDFNILTHTDFPEDNISENRGSWKAYQGWIVLVSNTFLLVLLLADVVYYYIIILNWKNDNKNNISCIYVGNCA